MTNQKILGIILLCLITLYGFILRIYNLDAQSYWIDEGYTLNATLSTLEKGFPVLDSGFHYTRGLLHTYLIAGSIKIGGLNPWSTRIMSVLFGTGFIVLIFFFTKKIFKGGVAYLVALLTAVPAVMF